MPDKPDHVFELEIPYGQEPFRRSIVPEYQKLSRDLNAIHFDDNWFSKNEWFHEISAEPIVPGFCILTEFQNLLNEEINESNQQFPPVGMPLLYGLGVSLKCPVLFDRYIYIEVRVKIIDCPAPHKAALDGFRVEGNFYFEEKEVARLEESFVYAQPGWTPEEERGFPLKEPLSYSLPLAGKVWELLGHGALLYKTSATFLRPVYQNEHVGHRLKEKKLLFERHRKEFHFLRFEAMVHDEKVADYEVTACLPLKS